MDKFSIGIDPGASGCVVVLYHGESPAICRMKTSPKCEVIDFLRGYVDSPLSSGTAHVALEQVASSPQMGVRSAFAFGQGYGWLEGVLSALQLPFTYVRPQVWQKDLAIPKKKEKTQPEHKRVLVDKARQLYPKEKITADVADALLIAHWCYFHCKEGTASIRGGL